MKHHIFAPGTRVRLIKDFILKAGREGFIVEVSLSTGSIEYSFEGCSWFPHKVFEFVKAPTLKSLDHVMKSRYEDDEEDVDD